MPDGSRPRADFYRPGHRQLQDQFDSRRLADRLGELTVSATLSERDRRIIEGAPNLWLATADAEGWPDVSYKGGAPGFVQILDDTTLAFPSYDGNGMFRSLGNILDNPRVGLLFCRFDPPWRVRVKGRARVTDDPDMLSRWPGAQLVVVVEAEAVFPNCGRYLHASADDIDVHVPTEDHTPPEPDWKQLDAFSGYLPRSDH